MPKLVVGITGTAGVVYDMRLSVEALAELHIAARLALGKWVKMVKPLADTSGFYAKNLLISSIQVRHISISSMPVPPFSVTSIPHPIIKSLSASSTKVQNIDPIFLIMMTFTRKVSQDLAITGYDYETY